MVSLYLILILKQQFTNWILVLGEKCGKSDVSISNLNVRSKYVKNYVSRTTLARWRAAQLGEHEKHKKRRPYLASDCKSLYACEKWRMQIIREIAKKVAQIQNAGLGEFRIRDLNDEINKLLREKRHWEDQIKELGGPDYQRVGPRMLDHEGKEVPGNRGYKYFGAAKELPGPVKIYLQ